MEISGDEEIVAKNTLVVVIDVRNGREVVLENPSESRVTAVYADESILMLGSQEKIFSLTPSKLFNNNDNSPSQPPTSIWLKSTLPDAINPSNNFRVYAFWHTKNQIKIDVYAHSLTKAEVVVYAFRTPEGIEKLKMHKLRA